MQNYNIRNAVLYIYMKVLHYINIRKALHPLIECKGIFNDSKYQWFLVITKFII